MHTPQFLIHHSSFVIRHSSFTMRHLSFCLLLVSLLSTSAAAQNTLRIHHTDGAQTDIPLELIDSLTLIQADADSLVLDSTAVSHDPQLQGRWLWASREAGYYEVITFNADHTYTGYDNYFTYGFDTMTYGWFGQMGAILTLWSNGFGYQRRYNWFVIGLTDNALEVMTKMGPFTYYRLQPDVLRLRVGQTLSSPPANGTTQASSTFLFADGVIATIADGHLRALAPGTTYILTSHPSPTSTALIHAYQVIVE